VLDEAGLLALLDGAGVDDPPNPEKTDDRA
jgi:hypothetical protein